MLLRNFYNALALLFTGREIYNNSNYGEGSLSIKRMNGTYANINQMYISSSNYVDALFPMANASQLGTNIHVGTSDRPVSFDDYTMENYRTLTSSSPSYEGVKYDPDTKTYSNKVTIVLKNSDSSDFVAKEIGICSMYSSWLMYREVLDTPLTIPAGGTATYTHEFRFTMPTVE